MHSFSRNMPGQTTLHLALCAGWGGGGPVNYTLWLLHLRFNYGSIGFNDLSKAFGNLSMAFNSFSKAFDDFSKAFNGFSRAFDDLSMAFNGFSKLKPLNAALKLAKAPLNFCVNNSKSKIITLWQ